MPRLTAVFDTSRTEAGNVPGLRSHQLIANAFAVLIVLTVSWTYAKDPIDPVAKPKSAAAESQARTESVAIPDSLANLKLSSKQEEQMKEIMRSYAVSTDSVWKQFEDRYMRTITMEAAMLAAIEDSFTDTQRQKIRDHRRITAQHQKALSGRTDVAVNTEKANTSSDQTADVVKEELSGVGVTLTTEQQATAEKVQHQYRLPLRSLNREIHGLHERLLALEADKLVAIENVLTKDQLSQLRTNRQTVATATTVSVNKADSSKSE